MQLMVTDRTRRKLFKAALYGATLPMFGCAQSSRNMHAQPALVGCSIESRERFNLVVADANGSPLRKVALPERGHGVATSTQWGHAVAFGRRPGSYFQVIDYATGVEIVLRAASKNRHFYGHGVYSNDGKWLYATEGVRRSSQGVIGVYDVLAGYEKVAEFTGFGIGPHEIIVMPDDTLAVGVGGVHTDGRTPLNLDSMRPSLSYLSRNGELIEHHALPDHKLSIRHLAHDGSETVLCGQQYRGNPDDYQPLVAMHTKGSELIHLQAEPEQWARFNHYVASIAATDEWILATSPRGNCYGIWSKSTLELVELSSLPDASGVVAFGEEFRVSSGIGRVISQSSPQQKASVQTSVQWDNHWSTIG